MRALHRDMSSSEKQTVALVSMGASALLAGSKFLAAMFTGSLGILSEAPTSLVPSYELWTKRREPWLRPIEGAEQYEEDRK